jgi:hypothetical protein
MLNQLTVVFAVICLCAGAVLLYVGVLRADGMVLGGAAVMSLGLLSAAWGLKTWLKWKRYQREQHSK